MSCPLQRSRHDPVFLSQVTPTLLLDREFTIQAVSRSYATSTRRSEAELIGANVFEAFPANPMEPEGAPTAEFVRSVERVLRTRHPDQLSPLRYDVADRRRAGEFVCKRWALVNAPVVEDDHAVGVTVRVEDITDAPASLLAALSTYPNSPTGPHEGEHAGIEALDAVAGLLALVRSHDKLARDVANLRLALDSRDVIGQAKGILMSQHRCSADQAFAQLRQLSMDTNVRLVDVAAAIVYQLQGAAAPRTSRRTR